MRFDHMYNDFYLTLKDTVQIQSYLNRLDLVSKA